jgi:hypothetical protein
LGSRRTDARRLRKKSPSGVHGKATGVDSMREDCDFQNWLFGVGVRYLTGGLDLGDILSAGQAGMPRRRAVWRS